MGIQSESTKRPFIILANGSGWKGTGASAAGPLFLQVSHLGNTHPAPPRLVVCSRSGVHAASPPPGTALRCGFLGDYPKG
ncbi:hypothetical protein AV530_005433 [Patagioenas fasciata monilis]|uniref:Uncharacterized protein n=1 Tax=Patagioenas fasciata monilis TaxID=372326 RepID=A0A1V4JLC9_PATFA|nr:hypothetical protein AV530_005433 [Patagioenas fasciata monilis]